MKMHLGFQIFLWEVVDAGFVFLKEPYIMNVFGEIAMYIYIFPTCQVRVVRFYVSLFSSPSPASAVSAASVSDLTQPASS